MDILDSMQSAFDKGTAAVKGAVSGVAVEQQPFMRGFARMCTDGWLQGWHERNGGNLTYRMTGEEARASKPFFAGVPGAWSALGVRAANLGGACLVVTGAGRYLRNVESDISHNVGIVELNGTGDAYRIVWGLDGGVPTSELASHVLNHSARVGATAGASRVLYHAHPEHVIALTKILPPDARTFTRVLWKAMTECIMVFPMGVGVVECMVPGSAELARATSELMRTYDAVIWAQHGLFASGPDFDSAFGLMHTIEKAAAIHCQALVLNGGSSEFPHTIPDDALRAIARSLGLKVNEAFLEEAAGMMPAGA